MKLVLALALCGAFSMLILPVAAEEKTNLVIIFADDLGYGDLGCYGSPVIRTPHIDRMAAEGLRFTDFYAAASVCTPSRAGLLTGRYPIRSGMCSDGRRVLFPESKGGLPDEEITIAEALKNQGYASMHVGKWHLGIHEGSRPTDQGFDESFGLPYSNDMNPREGVLHREHAGAQNPPVDGWDVPLLRNHEVIERPANQVTLTKRYTEESVKFIEANKDTPFFLYLAHTFPHVPLFASPGFHGKSRAGRYGDTVEELDWSTGRILDALREQGLAENTLVFFTSDNGPWTVMHDEGGSAGPLREGKGSTWEGGMRVPGIAWWPGTIEPGRTAIVASILDFFPTAVALGGANLPPEVVIDGRDLSGFLAGGSPPPKTPFFYYRGRELFACRWGPWKAHFQTRPAYERDPAKPHDPPLLFHLGRDPSEKRVRPGDKIGASALAEIQAAVKEHQANLQAREPEF
ncbi:MAG: sulfatase [Verrucomicrobiota bacterium]